MIAVKPPLGKVSQFNSIHSDLLDHEFLGSIFIFGFTQNVVNEEPATHVDLSMGNKLLRSRLGLRFATCGERGDLLACEMFATHIKLMPPNAGSRIQNR